MKLINYVFLSMLTLSTISCASPKYDILLSSGRPVASPNYVLKDTSDLGMVVTFWFTSFTTIKDKDGTIIYIPHMMEMRKDNILDKNAKTVILTIEVYNPRNLEYKIAFNSKCKMKMQEVEKRGVAAISDLKYRHHSINLPISKDLINCIFMTEVLLEGKTRFMLGPIKYKREVVFGNVKNS